MVLSLTRQEILAKSLIPKVMALPLIIEVMTEGKRVVICHADYPHNEYEFDKPVDAEQVIWNRERVSAAQDGIVNEISGADLFIFGHTPARQPQIRQPDVYRYRGCILRPPDLGADAGW
jgi:serine/threonine protein phosphatase 1